ncbi:MAG: chemotaxis protein CheW [Gammaproteobacteria bacterium]|nr:chemotaxis protein CheW [Gammaproteobacteria bacterium]
MKKPFKPQQLVDQRNALTTYLEALLNEAWVEEEESEDEKDRQYSELESDSIDGGFTESEHALTRQTVSPAGTEVSQKTVSQQTASQNTAAQNTASRDALHQEKVRPGQSREMEVPPRITSSIAPVITIDSTAKESGCPDKDSETDKQQPPAWALPRCQVLTFTLGAMQMAAPLNLLNGIIPMPERLTTLPGQSQWFLGLARNREQNVQVIDLARVIQPQRQRGSDEKKSSDAQYILLIGEGHWGLLCNSISTVLTLEPQQVKWQRSPHVEYILGTVIDQMHSVLCVDTLLNRLSRGQLV